ncbi:MAG TPA: hypothetical protein VFS14_00215 [Candidatus Saccharimonadales bacterium]|nr:hypothetical protein [Candidatus Saccharimonadales bacterium]
MIAIKEVDLRLIAFFKKAFLPFARVALFVVFFWFGILKVFGLSPASPLAEALTAQTVGMQYFDVLFLVLSIIECVIGVLFLIPKATRIVIPLLLIHMAVVCSPLVLVPGEVWTGFLVPTLEGQYIIKNLVIVAVAIGVASQTPPLVKRKK